VDHQVQRECIPQGGAINASLDAEKAALQKEVSQLKCHLGPHPELLKIKAENTGPRRGDDLITELQSPNFSLRESTERKVVDKILLLMKDKNGEVQNQAVKW